VLHRNENQSGVIFDTYWSELPKDGRLVFRQLERNRYFYQLIGKYIYSLGEKPKVLEVGCGTAIDSYYLQNKFDVKCSALDCSEAGLKQAQAMGKYFDKGIILVKGSIEKAPFGDNAFDLIFSQGVMEHFSNPSLAYLEQKRILKKNGIMVVHVPQKYNIYSLLQLFVQMYGKERPYHVDTFNQIAKKFDLELIAVKGENILSIEFLRFCYSQFIGPGFKHYSEKLTGFPWFVSRIVTIVEEGLWRLFGKYFGKYYMMNIVGVFRKRE